MKKQVETLKIKMGSSPDFLEQILTKDVSTLEAMYDLIDNSIDAARNQILLNSNVEKDEYGLPKSYASFSVTLKISKDDISIADNCLGMDEKTLATKAFVIASSSSHEYGIGQYGIGLKRSLLKMGNNYNFVIDNGKKNYTAIFNNQKIGGAEGELEAQVNESSGEPYTIFTVYNLKQEIIRDIQNQKWINNAIKGLEDRYSVYFSKGFKIILNYNGKEYPLNSKLPKLRTDSKFLPKKDEMKFGNVDVIIESGIHESYYFPTEVGHSLSENRKLTKDFGIYFICNDRVIVKSSTDAKHGWKTKWHSEYNGFVCLVRFIAKSPSDLPWNTAKSAMREDASLFLDVIDNIQPIADTYRSEIKQRYNKKKGDKAPTNAGTATNPGTPANVGTTTNSGTPANAGTTTNSGTPANAGTTTNSGTPANAGTTTNSGTPANAGTATNSGTPANVGTATNSGTPTNVEVEEPKVIPPKSKKKAPPKQPARDREKWIIWENTNTRVPESYISAYAVLYEMGLLSSKDVPISCLALLRLFIEETVKTTLGKMGLLDPKKTQLSQRVKLTAQELQKLGYIDNALNELVATYGASTKNNEEPTLFSINSIQSQIHSARFHPNQSRMNNYWDELDPFLAACWNYIDDKDKK
ncbi:ATP-binding protein [Acinetobacter baylyi]|uniref:ATP-binding protein n=1 Tax=Acinetobacter baylyi TaxID=202950 RepID=UPI000EA3043F|nr:ATP-binding protein [Acinetobacter baylyi]